MEEGLPPIKEETGHKVPSAVKVTYLGQLVSASAAAQTGTGPRGHPVAHGATATPSPLDRAILAARSSRVGRGPVPSIDDQVPARPWYTRDEPLDNASAQAYAVPAAGLTPTIGDVPLDLGTQVRFTRATPLAFPAKILAASRRLLFVAMAEPVARAANGQRPSSVADALAGRGGPITATTPRMAAVDAALPLRRPIIGEGAPPTGKRVAVLRVEPTAMGSITPVPDIGRGERRGVVSKPFRRPTAPAMVPREVLMPVPMVLGQHRALTPIGARLRRAPVVTPFPQKLLRPQTVVRKTTSAPAGREVGGAVLGFPRKATVPETRRAMDAKGVAGVGPLPRSPAGAAPVPAEITAVPARRGGAVPAIGPVFRAGVAREEHGADPPIIGVA